jgi:hypothetical protein
MGGQPVAANSVFKHALTLEFKEQGSVTIFRVGIPVTEYTGLLAILVICS